MENERIFQIFSENFQFISRNQKILGNIAHLVHILTTALSANYVKTPTHLVHFHLVGIAHPDPQPTHHGAYL